LSAGHPARPPERDVKRLLTEREAQTNGGDYKPTLTASTKNLGDRVEIRIRDNGIGMTSDVKEQMFNRFFPTIPTGEGTGLGLSISHDIIVKQHGGSIEVETQPCEFTEIRVTLPPVTALLPELVSCLLMARSRHR
jgi:signal transduction histidine kinase